MKTLKVSLLVLCAFALSAIPGFAQVNPQFGPIAGQAYNYVPASNTPMYFTMVYTDPTQGSTCYNPVVALFNPKTQTGWACVIANAGTIQSQGTWQVMFGNPGLNAGSTFSTLAVASTVAPTAEYTTLTGSATVTSTITVPANAKVGTTITLIKQNGIAADFPTGGNIVGGSVTSVSGAAYEFIWDGTNWHLVL